MLLFPTVFIVVLVVAVPVAVHVVHKSHVNTTSPARLGAIQKEFITAHNQLRRPLGIPSVTWNSTLETYAQNYAVRINCVMQHSMGPYGENIFKGTGRVWSPTEAVNYWYSEIAFYHYDTNTCDAGKVCGHYTQVVWSQSIQIGCVSYSCPGTVATYILCEYAPPGNWYNQRPY